MKREGGGAGSRACEDARGDGDLDPPLIPLIRPAHSIPGKSIGSAVPGDPIMPPDPVQLNLAPQFGVEGPVLAPDGADEGKVRALAPSPGGGADGVSLVGEDKHSPRIGVRDPITEDVEGKAEGI